MNASKNWTSLLLLSCWGAVSIVACGEDPCEVALSCVERGQPSINESDAGAADASGMGGNDAGGGMGSSGANNGGGSGTTNGPSGMDSGGVDPEVDGGDAGDAPPPVCGVNLVVGCVASTQDAVFVSAGVAESGDGSQESPVKTIAEGIELARSQEAARIVVCNGVYEEQVSLTVNDSGRSLSGGYNCDSWLYNPDGETLVRSTERGYALQVVDTTQRVTIANFTFDALAGVDPGESSIAAFIANASDVRLKQVRLIAHEGQSAVAEVTHAFTAGTADEWPAQASLDGNDGLGHAVAASPTFVGGARVEVSCPDGRLSRSGRGGGSPPSTVGDPEPGEPGQFPADKGGAGSPDTNACDVCAAAVCGCTPPLMQNGLAGDPGEDGEGASEYGQLATTGWAPASGVQGEIGGPGGGGGGGDGTWNSCGSGGDLGWYGGGSGAAGGCGGNGGASGAGGGSSIALAILDSSVTLSECELTTANAGDGASGDVGQVGQEGGDGGEGVSSSSYSVPCDGGDGAQGGTGGIGGGGAGGVSAGVAWAGDFEPTVDTDTVITLGDPGAAGVGGDPGNNDGVDGVSQEVLEVPAG